MAAASQTVIDRFIKEGGETAAAVIDAVKGQIKAVSTLKILVHTIEKVVLGAIFGVKQILINAPICTKIYGARMGGILNSHPLQILYLLPVTFPCPPICLHFAFSPREKCGIFLIVSPTRRYPSRFFAFD